MRTHRLAIRAGAALALVAAGVAAAPAPGHVQVHPATAAPGDPVQFELLVPGERDAKTVEVALKIPDGVLPFSFEDRPGWHRQIEKAADGSIAVVRWHGDMARDAFVRFAFLAATPPEEGDLVWKAVQRYSDGHDAAWIGPPGAENEAAVTRISATAPRQNAGGESGGAPDSEAAAEPVRTLTPAAGREVAPEDERDPLALALGGGGLLLGALALAVSLRRRPAEPREDW